MVFKDGELELVTGSPGGSRIITTVVQIIVDMLDHGLNVAEAEDAPRAHDQLAGPTNCGSSAACRPTRSACWRPWATSRDVRQAMRLGQHDRTGAGWDADGRVGPAAAGDAGGGVLRSVDVRLPAP